MAYYAVDDGFADHPKVVTLQSQAPKRWKSALALWTLAGSWCAKQLTDGALPGAMVTRLGFDSADAVALVNCRLWHKTDTGYQFHEWGGHNPTRATVLAKREKERAKSKNWRNNHQTNQERTKGTQPGTTDCTNQVSSDGINHGSNRSPALVSLPVPSRPFPSQEREERAHEDLAALQISLEKSWSSLGGLVVSGTALGKFPDAIRWLTGYCERTNRDPIEVFKSAADRFRADRKTIANNLVRLDIFLGQIEAWAEPEKPAASPGIAPVSTADDFADMQKRLEAPRG